MSSTSERTPTTGFPDIPKADWWVPILNAVSDPLKLLALVALAVFLILLAMTIRGVTSEYPFVFGTLAVVLGLIVLGAVVVAVRRQPSAAQAEPATADKFRDSGPQQLKPRAAQILGAEEPRPDLDLWHRKLRPTLHQASFYTVPTYYLDTDLNVIDYNIAFEIVFSDISGRLRGRHVSWFIGRLKNSDQVYEHGRAFTERVKQTGSFPFVDLEPISYESRDFGVVEFTKVASQLHDEDGNLQGWAVALMIRSIRWADFEEVLKERLYLDKLWSVYSGPYDRILTRFPAYQKLIQDVTEVVPGENRAVADLGAGTGNVTSVLLDKGHRVTAVENNVGMLDHLSIKTRTRNGLTVVKASVENLECLNDASFDAVVMVNVLYAVDDPVRCLREVNRILKPGGVLGFSTTHSETRLDDLLDAIKSHNRLDKTDEDGRLTNDYNILARINRNIEKTIALRHTRDEYKQWAVDAGFQITRFEESTYYGAVMLVHARKA